MSSRPAILAYHAIGDCPVAEDPHNLFLDLATFETQMAHLAAHRKVVPLAEAMDDKADPSAVAITFDDGYRNVLALAAPVLARHGLPATVFVPTGWLGLSNEWDEPSACPFHIMTEEELVELQKFGITIETHGHAHLDMATCTKEKAREDIARSLEILEGITGRRPRYLAYPYGSSSEGSREAAATLGLKGALSIDRKDDGRFARGRVQVTRSDGAFVFRMKCAGMYGPLRHSRAGNALYGVLRPLARRLLLVRERSSRS
ncbi:MAG: polysaccharide deacetylase family protein [Actinomycetota bacterium]